MNLVFSLPSAGMWMLCRPVPFPADQSGGVPEDNAHQYGGSVKGKRIEYRNEKRKQIFIFCFLLHYYITTKQGFFKACNGLSATV